MPDWARALLPAPVERWLSHPSFLIAMTVVTVGLLVASIAVTPWVIAKLPRDYFKRHYDFAAQMIKNPRARVVARVGKNLVGVVLLVVGIALLILPGPGILCVLMALVLLDFPGKHKLERKIATRPKVLKTMNKLRRKMGKKPLVV